MLMSGQFVEIPLVHTPQSTVSAGLFPQCCDEWATLLLSIFRVRLLGARRALGDLGGSIILRIFTSSPLLCPPLALTLIDSVIHIWPFGETYCCVGQAATRIH